MDAENENVNEFEPLFPELPEDMSTPSDAEFETSLEEHLSAVEMIEAEDPKFIGDLTGEQVLAELTRGVEQIETIRATQAERVEAEEAYQAQKSELAARAKGETLSAEGEGDEGAEGEGEGEGEGDEDAEPEAEAEVVAEAEEITAEAAEPVVVAAARPATPRREFRRAPSPSRDRQPLDEGGTGTQLVAAAYPGGRAGTPLDRVGLAEALVEVTKRLGRPTKHSGGSLDRVLVASADFAFPEEMVLRGADIEGNNRKIMAIGNPFLQGSNTMEVLTASGGLCAPLTPFYDIPDFAVTDRPVRAALPSFRAERGGVSVPSVSTIGSITSAITVIEEADDALGGTFATKSCQDLDCPTWTDVAVGIISHCREYGNLGARAWPEGIAHENNLTMAAHSRTAETRLLNRIKALSINVTTAQVYNSVFTLMYAIGRAAAGIRFRLRLNREVRLRALLPEWIIDLLVAEQGANQFHERSVAKATIVTWFRSVGVEAAFYLDDVTGGTSQGFADGAAGALDDFPDDVQWALYVEGEFLHLDSGVLELGIVRDSTLNSTNDYQVFGETFENVARIGPTQGALWVTSEICPNGVYPALGTALSC